ncbi:hypothetical protein Tco_0345057 [Tanacetum coccineum]
MLPFRCRYPRRGQESCRPEIKKKSVRKLVERRVAKAMKNMKRLELTQTIHGGSGSTNTGGTVCAQRYRDVRRRHINDCKPHSFKIPWSNVKAMMTTEYCPATEIEKMEQELWTLTLKGNESRLQHRFHETSSDVSPQNLMPIKQEDWKVHSWGFLKEIKGNRVSSKPATYMRTINMPEALSSRSVQEPVRDQSAAPAGRKIYAGNLPSAIDHTYITWNVFSKVPEMSKNGSTKEKECRFGFKQGLVSQELETPESPIEIRSYLGLQAYYPECFIENFSKIAKPLTLLTQKNKAYVWGDKQEEAFQILKEKLCNAPVLALPDGPDDLLSNCDAQNKFWSEASKDLKALAEWLRGLERHFEQRDDGEIYFFDHNMYYELETVLWPGMKRDIAELTKSAHFLPIREDYKTEKLERFMSTDDVARHGCRCQSFPPLMVDSTVTLKQASSRKTLGTQQTRHEIPRNMDLKFGESHLMDQNVQETTEKIFQIKERLKTARSRQKSYADKRRKPLEFEVGDRVLLKKFSALWMRSILMKIFVVVRKPLEIVERRCDISKAKKNSLVKVVGLSGKELISQPLGTSRPIPIKYPASFPPNHVPSSNVAT